MSSSTDCCSRLPWLKRRSFAAATADLGEHRRRPLGHPSTCPQCDQLPGRYSLRARRRRRSMLGGKLDAIDEFFNIHRGAPLPDLRAGERAADTRSVEDREMYGLVDGHPSAGGDGSDAEPPRSGDLDRSDRWHSPGRCGRRIAVGSADGRRVGHHQSALGRQRCDGSSGTSTSSASCAVKRSAASRSGRLQRAPLSGRRQQGPRLVGCTKTIYRAPPAC